MAKNEPEIWGISTHIDIHECNLKKITDGEEIRKYIITLCDLLKVKAWGEMTLVHFGEGEKIAGYSVVQLIETSCLTGHFVDSTSSAYIDIFSCRKYDHKIAVEYTKNFFETENCIFTVLNRK